MIDRYVRYSRSVSVGFILSLATVAQAQDPWVDYAAGAYDIHPNITYATASNVDLKLDVYMPKERSKPLPVLMLFHGGGWVAGQKERNTMQLLPYLSMGWVVVNVEYRIAPQALAPAAVEDCRCALRWVWNNAKRFNIDTDKIVLTGGSAGGHLALITGLLPNGNEFDRSCPTEGDARWTNADEPEVKVAAIVSWYGIPDVASLVEGADAKHYAVEWFGHRQDRKQLAERLSPVSYVRKGLPPVISIHGDRDNVAPYAYVTKFHEALTSAGVPNELVTIEGAGHAGYNKEGFVRSVAAIRAFLKKHGIITE